MDARTRLWRESRKNWVPACAGTNGISSPSTTSACARYLELLFRQRHDARACMHRRFGQCGGLAQHMVGKKARGRDLGAIERGVVLAGGKFVVGDERGPRHLPSARHDPHKVKKRGRPVEHGVDVID